ncbi:MAG TPA: lipopolysaccharide heptosyltransferase I [Rhodoferax sp.]|nr:lipopolysaccharide heptosyltransferase I [Rhodoferax sp.]HQC86673.1 lipopolysaccharide heptosyltransferase I [Rhodoferax sp.]
MSSTVRKVLIVKLSSLGDVVHAMPAVQDLRSALPGVQIDWVVEGGFVPLAARCQGVGRVIACDLRRWRKSPFAKQTRQEWKQFKTELQSEAYDAVIDLQGLTKSALVAWLARTTPTGQRISLAHATDGSSFEAPARWVADLAVTLDPHVHAVQRSRLLCAKALDYEVPKKLQFGLKPGALAAVPPEFTANPFVPRKPVVALVHGTSRADKQWPVDAWIALGQRLNHSGFAVALAHGSAVEKATSETIAVGLDDAWVWPTMALDALTDTMARCAGVVGVDSGLSHIAVALGLPHVQIYNFDTAWRTGPLENGRQVSVFAAPHPEVDAVWQAWESLATPVLCQ